MEEVSFAFDSLSTKAGLLTPVSVWLLLVAREITWVAMVLISPWYSSSSSSKFL